MSVSGVELAPFNEIVADIKAGKMVILVDDADRENEGDLTVATECVTPEMLTFMNQHARGLICVSISQDVATRMRVPLQVTNNQSPFHTPFGVSLDHRDVVEVGVTSAARAFTMRRLLHPEAQISEFLSPGHVFPLIAHPAGVLGRQGQTEGSFDLARIAGFQASGVICEILNEDGSVAKGGALGAFARQHQLRIGSVEQIVRHRINHEVIVRETARSVLETEVGPFETVVFEDDVSGKEHLALICGDVKRQGAPLLRIHSECLTGDVLGSRRCDCGPQLRLAMERMRSDGAGVLLYLRQEGRGIGLSNKLKAYALQDKGHDTVQANLALGFPADLRDFAVAAKMLDCLGVRHVRLLTNNPQKLETLTRLGVHVSERVPLTVVADEYNAHYLSTKRDKLGHLL